MAGDAEKQAWIERVLGFRIGDAAAGPAPADALRNRFEQLESTYLQAVARDPPNRTALNAVMAFVTEQMEAGATDRATSGLDRLEKMLADPAAATKPTVRPTDESLFAVVRSDGQLVAYRKLLLVWDAAKKQAQGQIDGLKTAIGRASPALAKSADILDGVMGRLNQGLADAIDAALNASGTSERAREHARAAELARSYLMIVNFDPVFQLVDRNPVTPLTLRATLGDALKQLVAALPA
ncbi:MAG TPA: hypothetical protein VFW75_04640 [Acetobacteraceae bacterium]|nr:hypothetical protein [Acetobacteraceae bacterium]